MNPKRVDRYQNFVDCLNTIQSHGIIKIKKRISGDCVKKNLRDISVTLYKNLVANTNSITELLS